MQVQPCLFFEGRCEEAPEFYKKTLSAEVDVMMRYKDAPKDTQSTAERYGGMTPPLDRVMHATFRVDKTQILISDGMAGGKTDFKGFGLSVSVANNAATGRTFKTLSDDDHVTMPMSGTFFAHALGIVTNHLGIAWMVIASKPT